MNALEKEYDVTILTTINEIHPKNDIFS